MTVTPAVDAKVLTVHASSKKKDVGDCPAWLSKISARQCGSADSPIQCRSKRKCFGAHSSADTVGYVSVQQTSHSCASVDQASSSTTPTVGPEYRDWTMDEWKRVAWSDESRFLIHHVDGRVRVRRLPGEQLLPSCTAGHTQAGGSGIMLWGTFTWAALGPVVVVEQTMKASNYLNIIADQLLPYMAFVFPTGNGISQQDNAQCHKARIVLEWFEEHTYEFHLMSWPPYSPDLNPMEQVWDVMKRQLRAQTPPCPNISTLRGRCLDIWYNPSPVMYQKLVASMPRRVAAVLKAEEGSTRY
ncbi:Transposable element Tc1 transposase [Araneus ventricosus]|uniref:Transposable element Tc1 transposase n=1 Tax=Araneus ventricosus TaxID=182803 RepID=A0A4Y2D2P7_ARAVE|nr:Transposable element Tc1 transposase [Araneus ventricosus]